MFVRSSSKAKIPPLVLVLVILSSGLGGTCSGPIAYACLLVNVVCSGAQPAGQLTDIQLYVDGKQQQAVPTGKESAALGIGGTICEIARTFCNIPISGDPTIEVRAVGSGGSVALAQGIKSVTLSGSHRYESLKIGQKIQLSLVLKTEGMSPSVAASLATSIPQVTVNIEVVAPPK